MDKWKIYTRKDFTKPLFFRLVNDIMRICIFYNDEGKAICNSSSNIIFRNFEEWLIHLEYDEK
jgi:hypothetical protein